MTIANGEIAASVREKLNTLPITETFDLTANQINHLFSAPVTLIPAPGVGKAIAILNIQLVIENGIYSFYSRSGSIHRHGLYYGSTSGQELSAWIDPGYSKIFFQNIVGSNVADRAVIENQPVVVAGLTEDLVNGGGIATATVNAGGAGYAPGDTGYVDPNDFATFIVDTVDGGGAVTAFHFDHRGGGYTTGVYASSNNVGSGTGFTMNVTSVVPGNGTARAIITYFIVTLP